MSKAAERGASRAIVYLADMYFNGLGVEVDKSRAIQLYGAAAGRGEFMAQIELGRIYSQALGVSYDPSEARRWYAAAVEQEATVDAYEEIQEAKSYLDQSD